MPGYVLDDLVRRADFSTVDLAPAGLDDDNRGADPRDGRIRYQFPIHADPRWQAVAGYRAGRYEEVLRLLEEGRTGLIPGFMSKRGLPFAAYLVLSKTGSKAEFEFHDLRSSVIFPAR